MDKFILRHTLHQLQKQIDVNKADASNYFQQNDINVTGLDNRVMSLENSETTITGTINSLTDMVNSLQILLNQTIGELDKTKMINIKQDIIIRTMHNLQLFDAHDMFTDTFVDGTNIDWTNSIRAELMTDHQAIGKTRKSVVEVNQSSQTTTLLISKNGSSDEAISQTFNIDKAKELDKISIFIEPFSMNTWQPAYVSILDAQDGNIITQVVLQPEDAIGFIDIDLPDILLTAYQDYYLDIRTNDIYGYKVGIDTNDLYLPGTSYSLFGGIWTDNNHDITFKVWCFPSADENNATILTLPKTYATTPTSIVFEEDQTVVSGGVNYYVSRDGGINWKILQPGISTDLDDLPAGNTIVLKAYIMGETRINAWGYVITRGEA